MDFEKEGNQIVDSWHYKHYEDYIPGTKTIEGVMYQGLKNSIAQALQKAFEAGLLEAAKIAKECDCEDGYQCGCRDILPQKIRQRIKEKS